MRIEMLYFAWVREAIGHGAETVEAPDAVARISELLDWLATRSEGHATAFADRGRLHAAVDQKFVALDAPLGHPREVAIFPPVTGG